LWALKWALRCVRSSGIFIPSPNSLAVIVSEISAFIRTDRSTRLVILIKNIYTLWGRKRFCLLHTFRQIQYTLLLYVHHSKFKINQVIIGSQKIIESDIIIILIRTIIVQTIIVQAKPARKLMLKHGIRKEQFISLLIRKQDIIMSIKIIFYIRPLQGNALFKKSDRKTKKELNIVIDNK